MICYFPGAYVYPVNIFKNMLVFWSCKSPGSCNLLPTTSTDQALSVVVVTVVVTTCTQFCESLTYWIIYNHRFPPHTKRKWITLNLGHLKGFSFSAKARFFGWAEFVPASLTFELQKFFADKPPWFWLSFSLVAGHLFYYPGGKKSFWELSWGLFSSHLKNHISSCHVEVHFVSTANLRSLTETVFPSPAIVLGVG